MTAAVSSGPAGPSSADDGPPSPEELLAVDPATVIGQWADAGMLAAFRAENHAVWQRCRWLLHACRATADTTVRDPERHRAGKVAAATLGWSESLGTSRLEFSRQVLERLPALGEEMRCGRLEERKASMIVTTVADLDDEQARRVVDLIVGRVPALSYRDVQDLAERTAMAVDPGWSEARRKAAVARRRVTLRPSPSGAVDLCGLDLPADAADDAHERILALAAAVIARLRAAGHDAPVGPVRCQVMLRLLGPDAVGHDDLALIDLVTADFTDGPDDPDPESGPDAGPGPDDPGPDPGPGPGPDDPGPRPIGPTGSDAPGPTGDPHSGEPGPPRSPAGEPAPGSRVVAFRSRVAVRLGLRTALGLDERPGDIPGIGPVPCSVARRRVGERPDAIVRLLLYHPHGHLEHALTLRRPARRTPSGTDRRRRQVVELTATTAWLAGLTAAQLTAELVTRAREPDGTALIISDPAALLRRARRALADALARPAHEHPAVSAADADRRHPGPALAHWVTARDQRCHAPGCSADAESCDLDHTRPWEDDGRSVAPNLGPLCEADHLLKHDPASQWTVEQTAPGEFTWTAPTGTRHVVGPLRYDELPEPVPPAVGGYSLPSEELLALRPERDTDLVPRRDRHGRITAAAHDTAAHLAGRRRARKGEPPSRYDGDPDF